MMNDEGGEPQTLLPPEQFDTLCTQLAKQQFSHCQFSLTVIETALSLIQNTFEALLDKCGLMKLCDPEKEASRCAVSLEILALLTEASIDAYSAELMALSNNARDEKEKEKKIHALAAYTQRYELHPDVERMMDLVSGKENMAAILAGMENLGAEYKGQQSPRPTQQAKAIKAAFPIMLKAGFTQLLQNYFELVQARQEAITTHLLTPP